MVRCSSLRRLLRASFDDGSGMIDDGDMGDEDEDVDVDTSSDFVILAETEGLVCMCGAVLMLLADDEVQTQALQMRCPYHCDLRVNQ